MTTSGAGMIHPNGRRSMTLREFACLQGFPLEHKFSTSGVKRQIGNAVPPVVAKALLQEVKKSLMKADGLIN
jgi:DNA (cytosine-5)-methyltransferase 1